MTDDLSRTYRIGIIGYGGYGQFLARTWKSLPNVEVAALAGRTPAAVKAMARKLGVARTYSGEDAAQQMIQAADLDVIVVATPPSDHADRAIAALEAGKHVFCEKPLALTLEDAERVREAVRRTGKRLAMGFVLRYDPLFQRLKRLIEEDVFGDLHRIDFQNFAGDEALPPGHWFWDVSQSGGILVEHGVHFFDIYTWLVGSKPLHITGHRTVRPGTTQEDRVMATIEYENGTLASFYHAFDKPSRLERTTARLAFDRGYVEIDGWIALQMMFDVALQPGGREKLDDLLPGWKETERQAYGRKEQSAQGGGHDYTLTERVSGEWALSEEKQAVYEACARANLADLLQGIDDPNHTIQADVDAGVESIRIATAIPPPR